MTGFNSKILIVDDKPENLFAVTEVLSGVLGTENCELIQATNGNDALKEALNHGFALAIIDVQMPDMNGYELAELMRSGEKTKFIPIIFLSAVYSDFNHMFKGYEAGGVDFLVKPYNPEILGNKVKVFLELDRYKTKLEEFLTSNIRIKQEIAERRKLEEELVRVKQLESISILAGGIAHDFNNLLAMILGNISLAMENLEAGEEAHECLVIAEKTSLRARDLTKQLLTFKGGAPVKSTASLGELIKDSATFALSGSNVKVELSISGALWPVEGDEGQIGQVIQNLMINADQAMPEGGKIEVTAENINVTEESGILLKEGKYLKIAVRDQGVGIPKEDITKVFTPYFTTKNDTTLKGSGLGLSICHSIIKNHDGLITVDSQVKIGTTFTVYLPACPGKTPAFIEVDGHEEEKKLDEWGKILVMDDEEAIRKVSGVMLGKMGFDVAFAEDGVEAIGIYKKAMDARQPFDVVIMDLTIPGGMGGMEAIKELLELDPEVKAVVSSGYVGGPLLTNYKEYGFSGILDKPYRLRDLSKVLSEMKNLANTQKSVKI